jgi:hypothetical protein
MAIAFTKKDFKTSTEIIKSPLPYDESLKNALNNSARNANKLTLHSIHADTTQIQAILTIQPQDSKTDGRQRTFD